ncbi:DMT family transporter [Nocardioides marmorisolisilvae]|uniref:DMT family transporter n=1 Tax=Nocardioides marmorisolisilvae TaxID=1542737 RepID=A0A3N0DNS3_9ACTN|nr:DMT family transporter [Nocardioides marmorisolisilvae]RNL77294.1 DMT family transporter [Nocardioides marmorisolisilvae]
MNRIDLRTLALLAVGVGAVSLAAPLIAATAVPALAIAFWRTAFATAAIAPVAAVRQRGELAGLTARQVLGVVVAGCCLAAHFGFWITSLGMTSVASSTAIVSLQVIWVIAWDRSQGTVLGRPVLLGVLAATTGAIVVSGFDLSISTRALAGDALALVGSVAVAAYAVIGGRVRQQLSTTSYTLICYGTCAVVLLVAAVARGQALGGYDREAWLKLLLLTATAQLLGHSVFNYLLGRLSPMVTSMAILLEIPGASLIAAAWLGQVPEAGAVAGLVLILAGIAMVVRSAPPAEPATAPA